MIFPKPESWNRITHLLQIRLGKFYFGLLSVSVNDSTFQKKCDHFRKVIETESESISTIAQKNLRGVAFGNKFSNERLFGINVKMCGDRKLLGSLSAAEQSIRYEPIYKTKEFRDTSNHFYISSKLQVFDHCTHLKLDNFLFSKNLM